MWTPQVRLDNLNMKRFPVFVDVSSRPIVVIGGGAAALRKARLLIAAEARPVVIWPEINEETQTEIGKNR